jgi:hypothetical protein
MYVKGKAIPVTGHGGPLGCEMLRLQHFLGNWLSDGGKVVSLMHRLPFIPRKIPGIIFVRGWVNPRAIIWLEGLSQLKIQWSHWESNPRPSGSCIYIGMIFKKYCVDRGRLHTPLFLETLKLLLLLPDCSKLLGQPLGKSWSCNMYKTMVARSEEHSIYTVSVFVDCGWLTWTCMKADVK